MTKYQKRLKELITRIVQHYAKFDRDLDSENKYYTYALLDPRKPGQWEYDLFGKVICFDHQPFYIGKGKSLRMYAHLTDKARHRGNRHKRNLIEKIRRMGHEPIVKQVSAKESEVTALAKEHILISCIGRSDLKLGPLTNLSNGGQGPSGYVHTKELRQSVSLAHTGKIVSQETREKLRIANTGKTHSAETRKKLSEQRLGVPLPEAHRLKLQGINKGRKMSVEAIAKSVAGRVGFKHSEESKAKMRKPKSDSARAAMSEAGKRRAPISEETRAKLRVIQSTRPRRKWTEAEKLAHSKLKKAQFKAKQKLKNGASS